MDNVNITVNIANRQYRLEVKSENERFALQAAEEINQAVQRYQKNFQHKDVQDILAMILLQNTAKLLNVQHSANQQDELIAEQIAELEKVVMNN
jgi:cell division protein ZapA (FtsZ GTPase activity inhibitor)